jgi:hypothetical protein
MSRAEQRERNHDTAAPGGHRGPRRPVKSIYPRADGAPALPTSMSRTSEMFTVARQMLQYKRRRKYMATRDLRALARIATGLCFMFGAGCSRSALAPWADTNS